MRFLAVALLLLAGCSRPADPTPTQAALPEEKPAPPTKLVPERRRPQLTMKYKGMDAAEWAERLRDVNWETARDGAAALRQLGEDGVPFLLEGMDSPTPMTRCFCIQHFQCTFVPKYAAELAPRLKALLKDSIPDTRLAAAILAGRLPELRPDLEAAHERELPSPVKDSMAISLKGS